jgi:hypothetical protein
MTQRQTQNSGFVDDLDGLVAQATHFLNASCASGAQSFLAVTARQVLLGPLLEHLFRYLRSLPRPARNKRLEVASRLWVMRHQSQRFSARFDLQTNSDPLRDELKTRMPSAECGASLAWTSACQILLGNENLDDLKLINHPYRYRGSWRKRCALHKP